MASRDIVFHFIPKRKNEIKKTGLFQELERKCSESDSTNRTCDVYLFNGPIVARSVALEFLHKSPYSYSSDFFSKVIRVRLLNSKTTDLDWYYSGPSQKMKFLIRDLLFVLFVKICLEI